MKPLKLTRAMKVFYCYAKEDEKLQEELVKHLSIMKRQQLISDWHYRMVEAGKDWQQEIDIHLNSADIILFLLSPDFMASDYCYDIEVKRAIERYEAGEACCLIPIILRPVDWMSTPFSKFQVLPKDGKPITNRQGRHGRDKAFLEITLGIQVAIEAIKGKWWTEDHFEQQAQKFKQTSAPQATTYASLYKDIALLQIDRANRLFERGRLEEANEVYSSAIMLDPDYFFAHSGKGYVLQALEYHEEALLAFKKALHLDPYNSDTYTDIGDTLVALNHYKEAITAYQQALSLNPNNVDAQIGLKQTRRNLGRFK